MPCESSHTPDPHSARRVTASAPLQVGVGPTGLYLSSSAPQAFDLVELADTIEPGSRDQAATILDFDGAGDDLWSASPRGIPTTCDPQQGLFLAGERHLALFHAGAGQHIPVPGVRFHLAKTEAAIPPSGSGSVHVWRVDEGTAADSSFTVTAQDWLGHGLPGGAACYVLQHLQSKRWYALHSAAANAARVRFGVCQTNWSYEGHYPSDPAFDPASDFCFVTVKECADRFGAAPTGDDLTVTLLPSAKGDPNLVAGDVIAFVDLPDSSLVCASEYMDDPIGTVKMFDTPNVPLRPGWECMSEMEADGGRFPLATCSDAQMGEIGGNTSHNHGGATGSAGGHDHGGSTGNAGAHNHGGVTGTGGEHDHDGFTSSATTEITIAKHTTVDVAGCLQDHTASQVCATITDHVNHVHTLPVNYRQADGDIQLLVWSDAALTTLGFDYPFVPETGPTFEFVKHKPSSNTLVHQGAPDPSDELALLHPVTEPNGGAGHKHSISPHYGHTHTIADQAAHAHAITAAGGHTHTIGGASHLNPYYKLKFIRRIDNAA